MSNKIKEMLKSILLQFNGVSTDKGELTYLGDKELQVGDEVYLNELPAPDGDYVADDKVFVVKDGKVEEIRDKEVEEETPENLETETTETTETETTEDKDPEEDETIKGLETRIAELEKTIADLVERITKIETTPVVDPVVEEFDNMNKKQSTGNKTVDKYSRIFGSK